jgi:hypothetical protein
MRRSLRPYVELLENMLSGRISTQQYSEGVRKQFHKVDVEARWVDEWGEDVFAAIDQVCGDAEAYIPSSPDSGCITTDEFVQSSRRNLEALQAALVRRGLDPTGK